jgi:phospholipase/carboxylesterase
MQIHSSHAEFAGLNCRIVDALPDGVEPQLLIVLSHGFGAPAEDLVDFAPWLLDAFKPLQQHCRFVFPAAPLDMTPLGMPGGRAWWPINMERLQQINEAKTFDEFTQIRPEGLLPASEALFSAIREMQQSFGVDDAATVVGGFSQGAMVTTDVVLRHEMHPALLVLFSGTLLDRDEWQGFAAKHKGCRVIQTHGKTDPVLPFVPATQLRDMLQAADFDVQFQAFPGQHTIPPEVLLSIGETLVSITCE